jgi:ribulose-5-phosphate 4-epimerase/fuculose-1-phosphate aldolase
MQRRDFVSSLTSAAVLCGLPVDRTVKAAGNETDTRNAVTVATDDLLAANHILSNEGVIDAFGHVSCRHPARSTHFLMSRARAPGLVVAADLMEFDADGKPLDANGRHPYLERFIHAAVYEARPDITSVIHDHSVEIIPFSVSSAPLRPLAHTGGLLGESVPVWDIREQFGANTNLLVADIAIGRDLAKRLGSGLAVLMRGHGAVAAGKSIRLATYVAITLNLQARLQREAMALGDVKYLAKGEIAATAAGFDPSAPGDALGRVWEYWCARAGVPFYPRGL